MISVSNDINRPVSSVVKTSLSLREIWGSIPGPVKSDIMARHRCNVSSELCCPGLSAEKGPSTRYTLRRINASRMKN